MRAVTVSPERPMPRGFRWSPAKVLLIAGVYAAPLVILCFRLHMEMQAGTLSLNGSAVLMRFIVVGLFSLLFSRWCMHWIKGGR
jgi:hypothetical protein